MAKIKVVKKEKSLHENMSEEYKQMLNATGAHIVAKKNPGSFTVMSTYTIKNKRTRTPSKKKKKRK